MARKRWRDMMRQLLFVYAIVELAVIVALASTVGWLRTLLILLVAFVLAWGVVAPMTGSHLLNRLGELRSGLRERGAVSDSALVTVATALVLLPGLVTSVLGLLLLVPPIREVAGPKLATFALRGLQRRVPLNIDPAAFLPRRRDYIDGEVVDVKDVEPPALPQS